MTRYPGLMFQCIDCGEPCRREDARCRNCRIRFETSRAHVSVPVRFWSLVATAEPEACWLWRGTVGTDGYGAFLLDQTKIKAHRMAYGLVVGLIPAGLSIDHLCRNRLCVNPGHLEVVERAENARRTRRVTCGRGHEPNWRERSASRRCMTCSSEDGLRRRSGAA